MKPVRKGHVLALLALLAFVFLGSGCDDLNARREIKEANRLYKDGKFEEAAAHFESALQKVPELALAHHNLGLTYYKMFRAGDETPANKAVAGQATEHLAKYLESFPDDLHIRDILTRVWIDSGDYPKALAFWQKEHDADPKNRDVIEKLAGIHFKAGNWEQAMTWYQKEAEVSPDDAGRIAAYLNIGKLAWNKLSNREKTTGAERIKVADLALSALQKAEALDSRSMEIEGYLASVYEFRSLAHGVSWAAALDRASTQAHRAKWRVLKEEADKAAKQNPTTPAAPPAKVGG
jgi:tetratricopeptide (TPR) repeat protein